MWGAAPLNSCRAVIFAAALALLWIAPSSAAVRVSDSASAAAAAATITSVNPMSGAVGSVVTITGTNFVDVSKVTFYDHPAASFTVNSPTSITAVVPAGTPSPGRWRVVTPAGTAVYDPLFTITGTPTITSVSPMSGTVGSAVTITGSNFANVTKVTFYDYPSPSFTVNSPTSITAAVPAGTPSPGRWRVVNPAHTAVYDPLFTVTGTPTITGVSPMSGPVGGTVTITGSNFANVTKVTLYDYPSPSFTFNSPSSITAVVPAGTPSPGRWRVVNPAYTAVYSPLFTIGPDATGPTTPAGLVTGGSAQTGITLSWSASSDNVGVTGYSVYLDGSMVASTAATNYTFGGLVCGTSYTLGVAASDGAGNTSPRSILTAATSACQGSGGSIEYRFAYSNRADQNSMPSYGYNLIDVATKSEADATPAGTQGQVWLYDYDNTTCGWEKDDAYIKNMVSPMANDPKVAGFYFANESDPIACPNAIQQHRGRHALIKSLAPNKYTILAVDSNWRDHFSTQVPMWKGVADYLVYNPYICYVGKPCDFAWLDTVIKAADTNGTPYFIALQAFAEGNEWRWPTASEEKQMLDRLKTSNASGYMTFSWNWNNDPLLNHPDVLQAIKEFNLGTSTPGDTTPPTAPAALTMIDASQTSVSLSWGASTDNVGVSGYNVYRGSSLAGSTSTATYTVSGLACGTSYTFAVEAKDAAGNTSPRSTVTATTTACSTPGADTVPPSTPSMLSATAATSTSLSFSWGAATDNIEVVGYGVYRNGTLVASTAQTNYSFTGLSCGTSYALAVDAYDAAGNRSPQTSLIAATSPCPDTIAPTAPGNLTVTATTTTSIALLWSPSLDNVAVGGYELLQNGTKIANTAATDYTFSGLTCATSYALAVRAYDVAGNRSPATSISDTTSACSAPPPPPASDPVIAAAGDICASAIDCDPTADLVEQISPARALTLGDNAYPDGTLSQFNSYYEPNWGRFKAKTSPAPGNHDYHLAGASGYFSYFGSLAPAEYYSYDVGSWHLISLNSEISVSSSSAQLTWLRSDLAAHANKCTLAYWHKPRFSSGTTHGGSSSYAPFWDALYAAKADVVLTGHEHNYERFAKQNPSGAADATNGIRQFVVGTGGASHGYPFGTPVANSEVRNDNTWGVLKLTLHPTSYDWQFVPIAGSSFTDSGSGSCH